MVEVEDRLDTAQAAQEKLWDDAELRTKLAIAEDSDEAAHVKRDDAARDS